jgi:hypothetical protein
MKIPKKLKIGGHTVEVIITDKESKSGTCYGFKNYITIHAEAVESIQEVSLIHEILEYITGGNDIELSHQSLSTISEGLYQVLKDNNLLKE